MRPVKHRSKALECDSRSFPVKRDSGVLQMHVAHSLILQRKVNTDLHALRERSSHSIVDPNSNVVESNEANNTVAVTLIVDL